ncbi:MAG: hypothetical protein EA399_08410 [Desulfovibrionales bacterium]|nr:MAG: hypothetical protein EA399_08410 [Desulfovibrionales bacterium]
MQNNKAKNKMNNIYYHKIQILITIIFIASMYAIYSFYIKYSETDSILYMIFTIIFLMICIIFVKQVIIWRSIEIDCEFVTVRKFFCKPIKINISDFLY